MTVFNSTREQTETLRTDWAQFRRELAESPPAETARTYGFEVETPSADMVRDNMTREDRELVEFDQDASITEGGEDNGNEECFCDCRNCLYHSCNCDDCESEGSENPSHDCDSEDCYGNNGVGDYQEIKTLNGGVKTTHPEALDALDRANFFNAKITGECGLHVHIYSGDLTDMQVSRVMSAYRIGAWLFDTIADRITLRFAQPITEEVEEYTRRGHPTDKFSAVSTKWHYDKSGGRARTLEFRQHAGTNSTEEVRAWSVLLLELVEYAKSTKSPYWVAKATTLAEFREALK
jgi:hypothetical protein